MARPWVGTVSVTADANDNIGVERVEFLLDGCMLGSDSTVPCATSWNASGATNGTHVLQARAVDLAGNTWTSAQVSAAVTGGLDGGGVPTTATLANEDANDGYVKAGSDGSAPAVGTLESTYGLAIGRGSDARFNRTLH